MDIGNKIRELRQEKGFTVNKLANLAGVSQSYLRDIELGNKQPTVEYLSYICDALGITLEAFFTDGQKKDELSALISALTTAQRTCLIEFIKSMQK